LQTSEKTGLSTLRRMSTVCGSYGATTRLMSDLTSSLATLAERLGRRPATACVQREVADGASPPGVVDLTGILATALGRFAREGQCLEVRVPWLNVTLWFVPDERDAEALVGEGVSRGLVWTATELGTMMALLDRTALTVQALALTKHAIGGEIVDVRPLSGRGGRLIVEADHQSAGGVDHSISGSPE
jgi:hypothetical protein